jgi:serine/threonine protein kinase
MKVKATNRFLERASSYSPSEIDLQSVFRDSSALDVEDVLDALETIGERRLSAGAPIRVHEFADGLEHLMQDELILDAGIEICVRGLTSSGMSESEARKVLLSELADPMSQTEAYSLIQTRCAYAERASHGIRMDELPIGFGPSDEGGTPRYELRRVIGSGSQGTVFEARDRVFNEDGHASLIAIKVLNHPMSSEYGRLEGARARRLRHPNIARVFDMGVTEDGRLYITQELVDGVSLDLWAKSRTSPIREIEALEIVLKIAQGIEHAHANGVVHRDLKPANILIDRTGNPIITDFGVAQSLHLHSSLDARGGWGTLAFRAPEQSSIRSTAGLPLLDVYAVAGILSWLLTGRYPNGDTAEEARQWIENQDPAAGPGRILHGLDRDVSLILHKGLSPDPADRYQSISALLLDIQCVLDSRPITWSNPSLYKVVRLFIRRQPVVAALIFVALLLITGGAWLIADSVNRERINQLNQQVQVEQERIAGMKRTGDMMSRMINSWFSAADASDDPMQATINMQLMHAMSVNGVMVQDPLVAKSLFEKQIAHGEAYLASLDPRTTSPFDRAILHELIGIWCADVDQENARLHLNAARSILESSGVDGSDPWYWRLENRLATLD